MDVLLGLAEGLPSGAYTGAGIERYLHSVLARARSHRRLRRAAPRALPDRHRPRHLRADRVRRRGLRRRADLDRRARVGGAADGLRAGRGQGPRADRRRDRLDHEPRHRGRGGREARRRDQPDRAVRERLRRAGADAARARARGGSRTWASRRSATRRSSCSPTSACTRWPSAGRSAIRASTSC